MKFIQSKSVLIAGMIFLLSCQLPPPTPEPEPSEPPAPVKVIKHDDFNAASLFFARGGNAGNSSVISNGQYNLVSNANESAWIFTDAYGRDSLIAIRASVTVSADFYIGLSPTINTSSTRALFDQDQRLLFYVYRNSDGSYAFHEKFRDVGEPKEFDPVTSIVPTQQCYLAFAFDSSKTVRMLYSADGITYSEIGREVVSWNSVHFAIAAWKTPVHGVASVDWAEIEYWSMPDTTPPTPPAPPVYHNKTLIWNRNKESDLLGYNVHSTFEGKTEKFFTRDTSMQFDSLQVGKHAFYLTALDNVLNESAPSDTVSF